MGCFQRSPTNSANGSRKHSSNPSTAWREGFRSIQAETKSRPERKQKIQLPTQPKEQKLKPTFYKFSGQEKVYSFVDFIVDVDVLPLLRCCERRLSSATNSRLPAAGDCCLLKNKTPKTQRHKQLFCGM